ncbi:MAG: flagellar motor protein MotB [Bacteroidia bacterium]|nr:flagellar motor protein MotB [Bacteroidia bacterium]
MKSSHTLLIAAALLLLLPACVSSKKYKLAVQESLTQDSLRQARERDIQALHTRVSQLGTDTTRLGQGVRELRGQYAALAAQAQSQAQQLNQQLSVTSQELQKTNQELEAKKKALELFSRELELREAKVRELNAVIQRQDSLAKALLAKVEAALVSFSKEELSVYQKDGKVYVSLSEKLLFQSGSAEVNTKGREALVKLADVLNKNQDIQVMIEGHTDNVPIKSGLYKDNWDLSVLRATSVVRILVWGGKMDPKRLIPSGRGEHFPVGPNDTKEGKQLNRRTEIILSPRLDELFNLLQSGQP